MRLLSGVATVSMEFCADFSARFIHFSGGLETVGR